MLKALVTFFIGLHLLPGPTATPIPNIPTPQSSPATAQQTQNTVSIPDEVYADLALQHQLDHVSVYYFDTNPKNTVSINADKNWDPASTIKLFVAMYAFDQVAHGKISLSQNVVIDPNNVAASESYAQGYPQLNAGDNVTIFRLVDQMITQSDNTAYNSLLDILDRQQVTKYVHDLGLTNSSVGAKLNLDPLQQHYDLDVAGYGPNLITASDFATAFILINGGRIPGSTDLFNILARQKLNDMIPAYLPKNVVVAHKPGELDPDYHDGGIVIDQNRRYILSVFSDLGDPNIVAHISDLIYTSDTNLVGNAQTPKNTGEQLNAPIDPIVTAGESQNVLAANTAIIKVPAITASDIGIRAGDLANTFDKKQLPSVIIPATSPFHFLVTLGEQIRVVTNPIPSVRTNLQAENLKQDLADANDLITRGNTNAANNILKSVDSNLAQLAKDPNVTHDTNLQNSIDAISETRFSILGTEVAATQNSDQKLQIIKEVASEAKNTAQNVKPYVASVAKSSNLNQTPLIGQVVSTTANSITVKAENGNLITTTLDGQIKTRSVDQQDSQIQNVSQIPLGSTIAIAGGNSAGQIKPSFIMTNIASESANSQPVTVLKVNLAANTMVVASSSGVPVQIDLTPQTVIKGPDTSVSLNEVMPGDVVVVHAQPIVPIVVTNATPSASPSPSGNPSPGGGTSSPSTGGGTGGTPASSSPIAATNLPLSTLSGAPSTTSSAKPSQTPFATISGKQTPSPIPTGVTTKTPVVTATIKPGPTSVPVKTTTPPVILKGKVILLIPMPPASKNITPTTTQPKATSAPNPVPPSTTPPTIKH